MFRVSEILSPFLLIGNRYINIYTGANIEKEVMETARLRGQAVHLACRYILEGRLDKNSLDPNIMGYVEQFRKALPEMGIKKVLSLEKNYIHPLFQYSFTPDLLYENQEGEVILADIKTTEDNMFILEQLLAYQRGLEAVLKLKIDKLFELILLKEKYIFREIGKTEGEKEGAWQFFRAKLYEKQYLARRKRYCFSY